MHIELLLPLVAAVSYCPTFTCNWLPDNVCANYTGGSAFQLNSRNACSSSQYCSAVSVALWALVVNASGLSSAVSPVSYCVTIANTTDSFQPSDCGQRFYGKEFKNNETLVLCESYQDCVLNDGTTTTCMCVFRTDGLGVCEAHPSNEQLFGEYWDECEDDDMIRSEDAANYWLYYIAYWEYTQSTVDCLDLFFEINNITSLYDDYESGVALGMFSLITLS